MTLDAIIAPSTQPQVLGTGYGFSEGPAADSQGNVYFSDGREDSIHFYEPGKPVAIFVDDSTDANGMMFNSQGDLYVCEGAAHRVVAFDVKSKERRILASQFGGTHFNEPNDLAVDRHNGFYFTDPNYRHRGQETVMKEDTYYCSAEGEISRVSTVCIKPNGVLLSADDKTLYLADARGQRIYRYGVVGPGKLTGETVWIDNLGANPDGMTLDQQGNLYVCCGVAGVKVHSADGQPIGVVELPYASNCCFGGSDFSILFVTSRDRFLGIQTKVRGITPRCLREEE